MFVLQAIEKERVEKQEILNELNQTGQNLLDQMGKGICYIAEVIT